jgi:hypothetical protein
MNGKLLNELKGVSKKIAKWFMQKPETMDSDLKLMCNIWSEEIFNKTGKNVKELTAYDLLCMLATKELSNPESIRRSRVELQKKNPEFRGKVWEKRNKKMQKDWKEIILDNNLGYVNDKVEKSLTDLADEYDLYK